MRRLSLRPARLLRAAGLACVVTLSIVPAASAKMPYFTVEVAPPEPVAGQPIQVVVRLWQDADHTIPAPFESVPAVMDDLLVLRAAGDRAPDIPVPLRLSQLDYRFEGSVSLPAGAWTLVAFPDRSGWATSEVPAGYPDTIALTVREPGPTLPAFLILVAIAALLVALALGLLLRLRRVGRRSVVRRLFPT